MSTQRIKGDIVFICDDCDEHLETDCRDFSDANKVRRDEGWGAHDIGNRQWENTCPTCKKAR